MLCIRLICPDMISGPLICVSGKFSVNHGVNIRYDGNKSPRHIPKRVYVSWSCPTVRVTIVTYVHTMVHTNFS